MQAVDVEFEENMKLITIADLQLPRYPGATIKNRTKIEKEYDQEVHPKHFPSYDDT